MLGLVLEVQVVGEAVGLQTIVYLNIYAVNDLKLVVGEAQLHESFCLLKCVVNHREVEVGLQVEEVGLQVEEVGLQVVEVGLQVVEVGLHVMEVVEVDLPVWTWLEEMDDYGYSWVVVVWMELQLQTKGLTHKISTIGYSPQGQGGRVENLQYSTHYIT